MRRTLLATLAILPLLAACAPQTAPALPLRVVFFTEDSASLDTPANLVITEAAREARGRTVTVRGFTGPSGGQAFNQSLSNTRALAVRDALVAAGVPAASITVQPRGPVPFEAVATESRRVEIAIGT